MESFFHFCFRNKFVMQWIVYEENIYFNFYVVMNFEFRMCGISLFFKINPHVFLYLSKLLFIVFLYLYIF